MGSLEISEDLATKGTTTKEDRSSDEMVDPPEENEPPGLSRKVIFYQMLVGVIAIVGSIGPGMSLGYSAIALPPMMNINGTMHLTEDQGSWFASLAAISTPIGCLLSGPILDRFGRKICLLLVNVPCLLGWVVLATVPYEGDGMLSQLYVGRLLTGLSTGMTSIPGTVYLAEIAASPALRNSLVTWTSISIAGGVLIVYILGAIFQTNWRLVAGLCAFFPALSFVLIIFLLPESPVWLISKGKQERALQALRSLRGEKGSKETTQSTQGEFKELLVDNADSSEREEKTNFAGSLRKIQRPEVWKPLLIMNTFFFFQQASGVYVVIFYAVDVVQEAGVTIDEYFATTLIGLMRFVVSIMVSVTSKRIGRRPTAIVSGAGMTICMCILSAYLYLEKIEIISPEMMSDLSWIPVTVLLLYIVTSTVGFLTLPWAMIGELFPAEVRGMAGGATTFLAYVFSFAVVKIYPNLLSVMGRHGVFFFYGIMALLGTVFVVLFLPETLGRSTLEMQHYFGSKLNYSLESHVGTQHSEPLLEITSKPKVAITSNKFESN